MSPEAPLYTPDILDRIARPSPVWALGSGLALTCATGWALLEMIAGLASRRLKTPETTLIVKRAGEARVALMVLAKKDAEAVRQVIRQPDFESYNQIAEVPVNILQWAHEGSQTAQTRVLVDYDPAELDRLGALALFETVYQAARSIIDDNIKWLSPSDQKRLQGRMDEFNRP